MHKIYFELNETFICVQNFFFWFIKLKEIFHIFWTIFSYYILKKLFLFFTINFCPFLILSLIHFFYYFKLILILKYINLIFIKIQIFISCYIIWHNLHFFVLDLFLFPFFFQTTFQFNYLYYLFFFSQVYDVAVYSS